MTQIKREQCVENYDEALTAHLNKVDYIELCDNLAVGGTTPSYGVLKQCVKIISTPITVLIRARGGDFIYTDEEIAIMSDDIQVCSQLKYDSIRVGAITKDNTLDEKAMTLWKEKAESMAVSCHMAFDMLDNYEYAIDQLVAWGFDAILTKGHPTQKAPQNLESLKRLVSYAGDRICIIPGAGITKENYQYVAEQTGAYRIHGTKII